MFEINITTFFIGMIVTFALTAAMTKVLIPYLKKAAGQNIREDGPQAHLSKAGTPSMGGIAIVCMSVLVSFVMHPSLDMALLDGGILLFALVGFLDDYLKIVKKQNEGLKVIPKFTIQLVGAVAFAVYFGYFSGLGTTMFVPFYKGYVDLGALYIPFIVFTILAMVNAVNLTDGLDGLASLVTSCVSIFLAVVAYKAHAHYGEEGALTEFLFYGVLAGACFGFLMLNRHPAKIFMGDTGSLALGGGLTVAAVMMKMELFLPILGIVYVMEALSVCLQVGYFKLSHGKRIFKMAPLHHHFELSGLKETRVVALFWAISLIFCLVGTLLGM